MGPKDEFLAVDVDALPWIQAALPGGEPKGIRYRRILPGGEGLPMVHFSRYAPGWTEARHRHAEDEVLIITEGEIEVGGQVHRAPAVVFVGRGTLYGPLTAGPDGVGFYRIAYTEALMRRPDAEPEGAEPRRGW
jgi:hypothetical protein